MKRTFLYLMVLLGISFSNAHAGSVDANVEKFVGVWVGENVHQDNIRKDSWEQTRTQEGVFKMIYKVSEFGVVTSTQTNDGTWWLEDGYFYEKHNGKYEKAHKYAYEFIGDDKVKFIQITIDEETSEDIEGYSFVDSRVE